MKMISLALAIFSTFVVANANIPAPKYKTSFYCDLPQAHRKMEFLKSMNDFQKAIFHDLNQERAKAFWKYLSERYGCRF